MEKIKRFIIAIIIMCFSSIISLLMVSVLTYFLKWQSDKAMAGIIITYILVGFIGGLYLGRERKMDIARNVIEAVILSTIFILLLIVCSYLGFRILFSISSRFILIWLLVACSVFGGLCVKR